PDELIYATGTLPVRILGSHEPQDVSERHIYSKWCPCSRDFLAQGLLGRYDYLDGILQGHCCIHMKQAYVSWCRHIKPGYCYDLYVPPYLQSPMARANLARGLEELRLSLEEETGTALTPEVVREALKVYDTNRRLLRAIYDLRKQDSPPITGTEVMEVVLATMVMDKAEANVWLEELLAELKARPQRAANGHLRLLFIGSGNDDLAFLGLLDSLGLDVVVDEHCIGTRYFWSLTPDGADPIAAIADRLIAKPPCPNKDLVEKRRMAFLEEIARDFRVQGVIVMQQKFCDPHQWDAPDIKATMEKMGLPTLFLESDIVVPVGQFRTRVEAFTEMLELG
ncbi:MAG: 2-hydroxyacyl-CoA dehydratase family protein, partial [Chloroflexota bacterium]